MDSSQPKATTSAVTDSTAPMEATEIKVTEIKMVHPTKSAIDRAERNANYNTQATMTDRPTIAMIEPAAGVHASLPTASERNMARPVISGMNMHPPRAFVLYVVQPVDTPTVDEELESGVRRYTDLEIDMFIQSFYMDQPTMSGSELALPAPSEVDVVEPTASGRNDLVNTATGMTQPRFGRRRRQELHFEFAGYDEDSIYTALGLTEKETMAVAMKLQKKYRKMRKDICADCQNRSITKIYTSRKFGSKEKEYNMDMYLIDLVHLQREGFPIPISPIPYIN